MVIVVIKKLPDFENMSVHLYHQTIPGLVTFLLSIKLQFQAKFLKILVNITILSKYRSF